MACATRVLKSLRRTITTGDFYTGLKFHKIIGTINEQINPVNKFTINLNSQIRTRPSRNTKDFQEFRESIHNHRNSRIAAGATIFGKIPSSFKKSTTRSYCQTGGDTSDTCSPDNTGGKPPRNATFGGNAYEGDAKSGEGKSKAATATTPVKSAASFTPPSLTTTAAPTSPPPPSSDTGAGGKQSSGGGGGRGGGGGGDGGKSDSPAGGAPADGGGSSGSGGTGTGTSGGSANDDGTPRSPMVKPPIRIPGVHGAYAHAMYSAASKQNKLDDVEKDLIQIRDVFKKDKIFKDFVLSPDVKLPLKLEAISALQKLGITDLSNNLMKTLTENRRLLKVELVVSGYLEIMAAHRNIVECKIITARPLKPEQKDKLLKSLETLLKGKTMHTVEEIDASLIGGFIAHLGERQINMSMQKSLNSYEKLIKGPL